MYHIYKIENLKNHLVYVGLTNNPERRKARHFTDLARGRHDNSFLQKDYIKTGGRDFFSFEILWSGDTDCAGISQKEVEYIAKYDSCYNGYNQNKGGNFGPSNGGSHLLKSDILNILAACEFLKRPGTVLAKIYEITNTSVMRIKRGENHKEVYDEYHSLPLSKRKELFDIFNDSFNIEERTYSSNRLESKRKFKKEDIFYIFAQKDYGSKTSTQIAEEYHVHRGAINCIRKGGSYRDFSILYHRMSKEEQKKYVSLRGDA